MKTLTATRPGLDAPFALTADQIRFYRENGFVTLKDVLSAETIAACAPEISRKVQELNTLHLPMEQRTTYQKAFLQVMNIWTKSDVVREFVFSRRLARIAAELMGTTGVRMYHDQALYKEGRGGFTPWHADQYYWPLASTHTVTAWIPLQATPLEMGPLAFAPKSHTHDLGRELEISDRSESKIEQKLLAANLGQVEQPFELGEVSFHSGWTFHRAGRNLSDRPREVMTVIYMDEAMRLAAPRNENQQNDWDTWCPGAKVGEPIETSINPVLWSSTNPQ
ncbi:MAG TPA: phytanoyl-CoA dioxygenase family protein [Planctomycetota bacterium]|nr:phytanoyl-CoA dioxygenase family protein [Planctomycetota bacterium]